MPLTARLRIESFVTSLVQIESDLRLSLKEMNDEFARKIGEGVTEAIRVFAGGDTPLDFRRMHRVIVTTDFAGELTTLSKMTASGNPITYTNEEYATAGAKVLLLPRGVEHEILPVFNAHVLAGLMADPKSEEFASTVHVLHHEFSHVHDDNKKLDVLHHVLLKVEYEGKNKILGPLAESCWAEYMANRLSSSTATDAWISGMTGALQDAIQRTKNEIDTEILLFRYHRNLEKLMETFSRHGEFLPKTATYVMGYMDGLKMLLEKLSAEAAQTLAGSYFEPHWNEIHQALRRMAEIYPSGWKDLSIYDELAGALEAYYDDMGIVLSSKNGEAYVDVPFRPETTPALHRPSPSS